MTPKKKEKVTLLPTEKRAKGVRLPTGNPTLVAEKVDAAGLPANLLKIYRKVEGGGKGGVKLGALCPKDSAGRYARWLVRQLVKRGAVRAQAEKKT